MVATRPEDMAMTTPPRPIVPAWPVTVLVSDDKGVLVRTDARWRAVARSVTVNLSDAYEVSCRVRVEEVTRPERTFRLNPKEHLSIRQCPVSGSPASAMRCPCRPGTVAELGVRLGCFSEGEKRWRSYMT